MRQSRWLYETGLHIASRDLVGVQLKTQLLGRPEREPHGEFSMPGYGAYQTADERWLYLLMLTDGHWIKFCRALGLPEANDESLYRLRDRKKVFQQVEEIVRNAIGQYTLDDVSARLKAAGVGCTEVLPLERVLDSEQARWPGKLRPVSFRGLDFDVPEFPTKLTQHDASASFPPPELGQHTLELLEAAGLNKDECQRLIAEGAIQAEQPESFAWAPVRRAVEQE